MTTWHAYGMAEGMPRLLDLWDRHNIKVTSHMVGHAVELQPDLAKDLVARGHEAAAHGYSWTCGRIYVAGPDGSCSAAITQDEHSESFTQFVQQSPRTPAVPQPASRQAAWCPSAICRSGGTVSRQASLASAQRG